MSKAKGAGMSLETPFKKTAAIATASIPTPHTPAAADLVQKGTPPLVTPVLRAAAMASTPAIDTPPLTAIRNGNTEYVHPAKTDMGSPNDQDEGASRQKRRRLTFQQDDENEAPTPGAANDRSSRGSSPKFASPTRVVKPALTERQQLALLLKETERPPAHTPVMIATRKDSTLSTSSVQSSASIKAPVGIAVIKDKKVNQRNRLGETPLQRAAIKGDLALVRSLIAQGAEVNTFDNAGWTPLHEAANHGHYEVTEVLLRAGAEPNARGMGGETPLHDAAINEHLPIAKLLIKYGADINQKNDENRTPLDLCEDEEMREIFVKAMRAPRRSKPQEREERRRTQGSKRRQSVSEDAAPPRSIVVASTETSEPSASTPAFKDSETDTPPHAEAAAESAPPAAPAVCAAAADAAGTPTPVAAQTTEQPMEETPAQTTATDAPADDADAAVTAKVIIEALAPEPSMPVDTGACTASAAAATEAELPVQAADVPVAVEQHQHQQQTPAAAAAEAVSGPAQDSAMEAEPAVSETPESTSSPAPTNSAKQTPKRRRTLPVNGPGSASPAARAVTSTVESRRAAVFVPPQAPAHPKPKASSPVAAAAKPTAAPAVQQQQQSPAAAVAHTRKRRITQSHVAAKPFVVRENLGKETALLELADSLAAERAAAQRRKLEEQNAQVGARCGKDELPGGCQSLYDRLLQERQRLAAKQAVERERLAQWLVNEVTQLAACVPDHLVAGAPDAALQSVANINVNQHQRGMSASRYLSRRYSGQSDIANKPIMSMQSAIASLLQASEDLNVRHAHEWDAMQTMQQSEWAVAPISASEKAFFPFVTPYVGRESVTSVLQATLGLRLPL